MDPAEILLDADAAGAPCRSSPAGPQVSIRRSPSFRYGRRPGPRPVQGGERAGAGLPGRAGPGGAGVVRARRRGPGRPVSPRQACETLPAGTYSFAGGIADERLAALGWLLEAWEFTRYRTAAGSAASLAAPRGVDAPALRSTTAAVTLVRDLINRPANDLGPAELEAVARGWPNAMGQASALLPARRWPRGFR